MKIHFARGTVALLALLVALPFPRPARAEDPAPAGTHKLRVDIAIHVGFQHYKMGDVNQLVAVRNEQIAGIPEASSAGLKLGDLTGGSALGAGIRVWPTDKIVVLADYQSLKGNSDDKVPINSTPGSPELKVQVSAPAQTIGLTVGYFFLQPLRWFRLGAGVGGAYYVCNGNSGIALTAVNSSVELHGTGLGGHAMALGEIRVSNALHFELAAGYRVAKTGNLTNYGNEILVNGSPVKADYTGAFTRFGFSVPFGPK